MIEVLYKGTSIAHDNSTNLLTLYGILPLPLQCTCRGIHLTAVLTHPILDFPSSLLLFLYCSSRIDIFIYYCTGYTRDWSHDLARQNAANIRQLNILSSTKVESSNGGLRVTCLLYFLSLHLPFHLRSLCISLYTPSSPILHALLLCSVAAQDLLH